MTLFAGSEHAHGTYRPPDPQDQLVGGKLEIKTSARTLREPATRTHWMDHIKGLRPLGIVPIREDDTCVWGCVDIDKYDLSLPNLAGKISELGLPLFLGKSKSGGAHVFVFMEEPVSALLLQRWLRDVAARIGYAQSEIFPKQSKVLRERGDLGNWLVMPYFGDTMPVLRAGGGEYTLEEFLRDAEAHRLPAAMLSLPAVPETGPAEFDLSDGPPCLQHLAAVGFPEGTRNNGLLALGVYAKKRWPEDWEAKFEEMNHKIMNSAGSSEQMAQMKKNLRNKNYNYRCQDVPLVSHCNANMCRLRPHGVGDSSLMPTITGLSVLDTEPPVWFVDVGEDRLEMQTEQLVDYQRFHRICVERLLKVYPMLKRDTWNTELARAMQSVIRIESPPDAGNQGTFREELEEFLTNRQRGRRKEDLLSGKPWEEEGRHIFRLRDFYDRLARTSLRGLTKPQVTARLKDLGGGHMFLNINGKGVNVWWVPSSLFFEYPEVDPPKVEKEAF